MPSWLFFPPVLRLCSSLSRAGLVALIFIAALVLGSGRARADQPVLEEGREADVLALFLPHVLAKEVAETGWKLWNVKIEASRIDVDLKGPDDASARFSLLHPDAVANDGAHSASFAFVPSASKDPRALAAEAALVRAVQANDAGRFWRAIRPLPVGQRASGSHPPRVGARLLTDGLVLSLGAALLAVLLAIRLAAAAPRWVRFAVPTSFVLGVALRLWLAPATFLGAWPWSRLWPNVRVVFESPLMASLVRASGRELYLTDLSFWVNFAYAAAMPLVLFVHASQLLRSPRAGALASFAVALSPHHIRFSRCEDAFVPSLVLTSLAFALLHTWLRDPSRRWRLLALLALPCVLLPAYLLRPLNILFIVVYFVAAGLLHARHTTRPRRVVALVVVAMVGALALREFLTVNEHTVTDAATSVGDWLPMALGSFFSVRFNLLLQPLATAPALVVLAVVGATWVWRRGERRLASFLAGWLALFFLAHGYVTVPEMQPRYHLHLLVPFLLLASVGGVALLRARRGWFALAAATVAIAPLVSLGWIRDQSYVEQREYAFVRQSRELIAEGCTVVEFAGPSDKPHDVRFERIGLRLGGPSSKRFRVLTPHGQRAADGTTTLDAESLDALQSPGSCTYVYEGLGCWGQRAPDPAYAAECTAMLAVSPLETVLDERVPAKLYDTATIPQRSPELVEVRLALYKVVPRR
jgi:hypothetical protein